MRDNLTLMQPTYEDIGFANQVQENRFALTVDQISIAFDSPFLTMHSETYQAVYVLAKRLFDIIFSILMCILLLPLFAVIAAFIKISSPGPVIFRHRRVGQFGKEFDCLKFRTMVNGAQDLLKTDPELRNEFDKNFKMKKDPRIIKYGGFLRASSLDELPQFINVIRGEMTLIGPRPVVKRELAKYSVYQAKLLTVKPGLSGLWQVSGRSRTSYEERVALDLTYVDKRSFWLDIRIFFRTISAVIKGSGAR